MDRIRSDLERHYNKSLVIAAAITSVHIKAGKIPDPDFDISRSLPVLTAHNKALVATKFFLQCSDLPDKEDAVYQSNPVNDLILLMPDRVRITLTRRFRTAAAHPVPLRQDTKSLAVG